MHSAIILGEEGKRVKGLLVPQTEDLKRLPWKFYLATSHHVKLLLWRGIGGRGSVRMEVRGKTWEYWGGDADEEDVWGSSSPFGPETPKKMRLPFLWKPRFPGSADPLSKEK